MHDPQHPDSLATQAGNAALGNVYSALAALLRTLEQFEQLELDEGNGNELPELHELLSVIADTRVRVVNLEERLTPQAAVARITRGKRVRVKVAADPLAGLGDAPELIVWRDGGTVMSEAVAGWSAGVIEPVCALNSEYLLGYFTGRARLEPIENEPAPVACFPELTA